MVLIARKPGRRRDRSPSGRTGLRCLVAVQTRAIGMTWSLGGGLWLWWLWWLAVGFQRTTGHPLRVGNQRHHAALLSRKDGNDRDS